jgi:protein SCO1/2
MGRYLFLALFLCGCLLACRAPSVGVALDPPVEAQEITAELPDGTNFRLSDHKGKVIVLSFGYTYCPDVCPTTLSRLRGLYSQLGDKAKDVVVAYISVDPDRDTPERLGEYVSAFDDRIYPLSLKGEALEAAKKNYGIVSLKRLPDLSKYPANKQGSITYYTMDHTSGFHVIDKSGKLRLRIPYEATVEETKTEILQLLAE